MKGLVLPLTQSFVFTLYSMPALGCVWWFLIPKPPRLNFFQTSAASLHKGSLIYLKEKQGCAIFYLYNQHWHHYPCISFHVAILRDKFLKVVLKNMCSLNAFLSICIFHLRYILCIII